MDPTTVMAIVCSGIVFAGWLFMPHSPTTVKPVDVSEDRLSEERQPVRVSA
jgi:hypothetical protein